MSGLLTGLQAFGQRSCDLVTCRLTHTVASHATRPGCTHRSARALHSCTARARGELQLRSLQLCNFCAHVQDSAALDAGVGISSSKGGIASAQAVAGACLASRASGLGPVAAGGGGTGALLPSLSIRGTTITEEDGHEGAGSGGGQQGGACAGGHRGAREEGDHDRPSDSYGDAQQTGLASHTSFASLSSDGSGL
jgi:hypothetical protein